MISIAKSDKKYFDTYGRGCLSYQPRSVWARVMHQLTICLKNSLYLLWLFSDSRSLMFIDWFSHHLMPIFIHRNLRKWVSWRSWRVIGDERPPIPLCFYTQPLGRFLEVFSLSFAPHLLHLIKFNLCPAIINPTIYLYVTTVFNAESYWVGIITACSSLPSVIAGPLLGRWADKSGKSRNLILIAHLSRVIGMIMYTLRIGPWFVCIARFVTGINY